MDDNGKCKECSRCNNKMLCVTANYYLFVNFGDGLCFNFENKEFSRPRDIFRHLKNRYESKSDNTYNPLDRMPMSKKTKMTMATAKNDLPQEIMDIEKEIRRRNGEV